MKINELLENELGEDAKPDDNFGIEDIKQLEKIRDLPTLKSQAFALISKPSRRPMKPEKVAWFRRTLEKLDSHQKVIKLMYDLLLSGEGFSVIGSRKSMDPNSYRKVFNSTVREADPNQEPGEYDQEGDMAQRQLLTAKDAADELRSILTADENLPEWVQKKISLAVDYLDTARDYIKSTKQQDMSEEKQKGVDGKACWDGYKRMGTKMKGGKRVDNCVPIKGKK